MKEIWKDVRGHEGSFQVSSRSRVRSLDREVHYSLHNRPCVMFLKGKVKKQTKTPSGYFVCSLKPPGRKKKVHMVHRLIWEAFNGKIPEGKEINHKNGNKRDNKLSNLEVVTRLENNLHALRTGLKTPARGEAFSTSKLRDADVIKIRGMHDIAIQHTGKVPYGWLKRIREEYRISNTLLVSVIKRTSWKHVT